MPRHPTSPIKPKKTNSGLGQRQSRPREAIIGAIRSAQGPLTVPEIHASSQKEARGVKMGISTVYRTINLLLENGLIRAVILPTGETRYESREAGEHHHHHHFQCNMCQRVFDLDLCPVGFPEGTTIPGGYRIDSHDVTFYGLCPGCQSSKKAK